MKYFSKKTKSYKICTKFIVLFLEKKASPPTSGDLVNFMKCAIRGAGLSFTWSFHLGGRPRVSFYEGEVLP